MWLIRHGGGLVENVADHQSTRDEPFEVPDDLGKRLLAHAAGKLDKDGKTILRHPPQLPDGKPLFELAGSAPSKPKPKAKGEA